MPYITRDEQGNIRGIFAVSQYEGHEWVDQAEIWADPKDAIRAQIKQLEDAQLMPRATREFMLMYMETNAPAEVLEVNPGYQAVKAFDEQIKVLRAQL